jgi:hypothetical protein
MLDGETYILEAVRDTLREELGLKPEQCDCEMDEKVPAIAGDTYLAVIPAGVEPGPYQNTSGGVHDVVHLVQVTVFQRCGSVPRDKNRSVFMDQLSGINAWVNRIIMALDWQIKPMAYANKRLMTFDRDAQPFIERLRFHRVDAKPRMVNSETYGAVAGLQKGSTPYVAMVRSVVFRGLPRTQTVTHAIPS